MALRTVCQSEPVIASNTAVKADGAKKVEGVPAPGDLYDALPVSTAQVPRVAEAPRATDLRLSRAHFLSPDVIAWPMTEAPSSGTRFSLVARRDGGLDPAREGLGAERELALEVVPGGLSPELLAANPHLAGAVALRVVGASPQLVGELVQGQLAVTLRDERGQLVEATSLQLPGVLDALFANDEAMGATWQAGRPALRLWAPTARSVSVRLYEGPDERAPSRLVPMERDARTGNWSVRGEADWKGRYYQYEVEVYAPSTGKVERNVVTDPYSVALSANGRRTLLLDLDDPALKPPGWDELRLPTLARPEDIVLYEQHIRDFSMADPSVPEELRGTYLAFAQPSIAMGNLAELAKAGVTHLHLLPAFDFAGVEEVRAQQAPTPEGLAQLPPDSPRQQAALAQVKDADGFNWGYNPVHYLAPEGSYATQADGPARVLEFRRMVQGLSQAGLRTVMDVVFNHTADSGQGPNSVLDRIVPGYYHRLNLDGFIENSTAVNNTASEHRMMEKLMVDSVESWSRHYKVGGYRFDLMGHHMKGNLARVRAALDELSVGRDGIDGQEVYLYGEGWNFGEVANNARFVQASQLNMGGTGIGTFNDRLRDAARGGGPFDGLQEQGFATGLYTAPNGVTQGGPEEQREKLLEQSDLIRLGLAGNLASYELLTASGEVRRGADIRYHGQPAGYAERATDVINYVSAHDNETLFDAVQLKAPPDADLETRLRMHELGTSLVLLSQGIPFLHAGDELLRSKSLDRNSYDSGDWFNRLDPTGATSNWGVGLPPQNENGPQWDVMKKLLGDPKLRPTAEHIARARRHALDMLRIRSSSRLFRMSSAQEIKARVRFHNTGPGQLPGVIALSIDGEPRGGDFRRVLAVFNARPDAITLPLEALQGAALSLHPVQAASSDPRVRQATFDGSTGTVSVPPYTTVVFVEPGAVAA